MTAPSSIDSLRFARTGESLSGDFPVSGLLRLVESLASDAGKVQYRLCGILTEGRPALELVVEANVQMICQRCLGTYVQRVAARSILPVARDEAQLAGWERDDPLVDALLADTHQDVLMLVEDEMLLSLPVVPMHSEIECGVGATAG